jgi:hypothetical protein
MVKLTDNQLIVLSKAAAREDGAAVLPLTMNKAAAVKVGSGLIGGKLMRGSHRFPDRRKLWALDRRIGQEGIGWLVSPGHRRFLSSCLPGEGSFNHLEECDPLLRALKAAHRG